MHLASKRPLGARSAATALAVALAGLVGATARGEPAAATLANEHGLLALPAAAEVLVDPAVAPVQMMTPPLWRTSGSGGGGEAPGWGLIGGASVPFMFGDGGIGPSVGFTGLLQAELSHPTLGASRLAVADANTPLPVDRLYYSYRHMHNASPVSLYGLREAVDLDRHLIGWERTFWDRSASVELRLPIEDRLNSNAQSRFDPFGGGVDPIVAPDRQVELGNVSAVFKYLLWENDWLAISAGVGVGLPTARDVEYAAVVNGEAPLPGNPGLTAFTQGGFLSVFNNETVYVDPFLAWVVKPAPRWFHQGFLQIDVPANPARVLFQGGGQTLFIENNAVIGGVEYFTLLPTPAQFAQQTMLRLNLGGGWILVDRPRAGGLRQLTAMFEMHYAGTLQDGRFDDLPLFVSPNSFGAIPLSTIEVGNVQNRVDVLNAVAGLSANVSGWMIANGVIVPLRDAPDRGFDFQYNVQVQRPF